jgi:hypothetical protein
MIESLAILAVFLIAALIYLGARLQAQGERRNPAAELARLQESLAWHEDRLRRAKEKQWDDGMIRPIAEQLAEIQAKLHRFQAGQTDAVLHRQRR